MKVRARARAQLARTAAPAPGTGWRDMAQAGFVKDGGRLARQRQGDKEFIP